MARANHASSIGAAIASAYGGLTKVVGGLWTRYGGWGWSRIRIFLPGARRDWEREAGELWLNSIVALGIAWLGDRFPRPRVQLAKVARNGDHVPIGRHPVVDLWNRPNPYYTRRTMEKAIGLSLKVDGNAYIYKVRDNLDRVCQLWWIPHFRINPTWPSDGSEYEDGFLVRLDSQVYHLPKEDVIHIRDGIDPYNERHGLSALKSNVREVSGDNAAGGYTAAILINSGIPGVVIMPADDSMRGPDRDTAERMQERFGEEFGGDNAGRALVSPGRYKIETIGFSPEQLALDKLPQTAAARIAAAMGVAAMSLALPDPNKTYSNLGEANRASWGTVVSIQELIAEALQYGLLPEPINADSGSSPGLDPHAYVLAYDYAHIQELQESLDAVHKRTRDDWTADLIRRNEAREQLGYDAEGDPGEVYYSEFKQGLATEAAQALQPSDDGEGEGEGDDQGDGEKPPVKALAGLNGHSRLAGY